jgi:hypothetical protein
MLKNSVTKIEGLFLIIEPNHVKGLKHWGDELERRAIPAVIQIEERIVYKYLQNFKSMVIQRR